MEQENTVLCGANSYEEKYFFNEQFAALPTAIKDELKIMCVLFVNQVGGILLLEFAPDGTLVFRVSSHEDDFFRWGRRASLSCYRIRIGAIEAAEVASLKKNDEP